MTHPHGMSSTFRISAWDPTEHCLISAIGSSPADGLTAGLLGVLTAASPRDRRPPARDSTVAVPIRADGHELTSVFAGMAAALIDEICDASIYFTSIRVDGVLHTERGYTAWGYVTGRPGQHAPPAYCDVESATVTMADHGAVELRCVLTRDC